MYSHVYVDVCDLVSCSSVDIGLIACVCKNFHTSSPEIPRHVQERIWGEACPPPPFPFQIPRAPLAQPI